MDTHEDASNEEPSLESIFPEIDPSAKSPALGSLNGFGFTLYGHRDDHPETQTYVKTHCLTALFVPVLALRSYRVASAGANGWYVLGKVPLSGLAKGWNFLVLSAIICGFGSAFFKSYMGNETRQVAAKFERGEDLLAKGHALDAETLYRDVYQVHPSYEENAVNGARRALIQILDEGQPDGSLEAIRRANSFPFRSPTADALIPDLRDRGLTIAEAAAATAPREALGILNELGTRGDTNEQTLTRRAGIIDRMLAEPPTDLETAATLATAVSDLGRNDDVIALLGPHANELGESDSARLLGLSYMAQGNYTAALPLLEAYVPSRVTQLNQRTKELDAVYERVSKKAFDRLNNGQAESSWYSRYEALTDETAQATMVDEYISQRVQRDRSYQQALAAYIAVIPVSGAAIDLGIAQLTIGQSSSDPAERAALLQRAEQTFLSIRGTAGEREDYKMLLGQVYFWLSKFDEGNEQFDALLAANPSPEIKISLAQTLREVGETERAKSLCEEVYASQAELPVRQTAAHIRSVMHKDTEDEILWLERSDTSKPSTAASLHHAKGNLALQKNQRIEAQKEFETALSAYAKLPRSGTTLNNAALIHLSVFRLTGEVASYSRAAEMMQDAISLSGAESILLNNAGSVLIQAAILETIAPRLTPTVIQHLPNDIGAFFYSNATSFAAWQAPLLEHPKRKQGMTLVERALLLSPKSLNLYSQLAALEIEAKNIEANTRLRQKAESVEFDLEPIREAAMKIYHGSTEAKDLDAARQQVATLKQQIATSSDTGLHLAILKAALIEKHIGLTHLGLPLDIATNLKQASELAAAFPCTGLARLERSLLFHQADTELQASSPAFLAATKGNRSIINRMSSFAWVLAKHPELAETIRSNESFKAAMASNRQHALAFPNDLSPVHWAVWRHVDPDFAAQLKSNLINNPVNAEHYPLLAQLSPYSAESLLSAAWFAQAKGDDQGANHWLEQIRRREIPLVD